MKRDQIEAWLANNGWTLDRWLHYHMSKMVKGEILEFRMKMQTTSLRYEVKGSKSNDWVKLHNDYYKNITVVDNTLKVGKALISGVI